MTHHIITKSEAFYRNFTQTYPRVLQEAPDTFYSDHANVKIKQKIKCSLKKKSKGKCRVVQSGSRIFTHVLKSRTCLEICILQTKQHVNYYN